MDVTPWRETLAVMTQHDGWIGRRDDKAELASKVLEGYENENGWIGYRFRPGDSYDLPKAAENARNERDAILGLAVLHELMQWGAHRRRGEQDAIDDIEQGVVRAALTGDVGLRPKDVPSPGSKPYTERDFAHSENARSFFEETVRPRLLQFDAVVRAGLADFVPASYDPTNPDSIAQWGRVWTAGAVLVLLNWVRARGAHRPCDIARVIWSCASDPRAPTKLYAAPGLIPTDHTCRQVSIHLHTCAAVAYIFAGSEAIRAMMAEQPCTVPIALRDASDAKYSASNKSYRGYNRLHIYLALLSECTRVAKGTSPMGEPDEPTKAWEGGDAGAFDTLAPEQRAALAQTVTARRNLAAMSKAMTGARRLSPIRRATPSVGPSGADSMTGTEFDWEPMSQRSLRPLASDAEPGTRWQPIASIDIWRELGAEVSWIDLLVVARVNDRQVPLPVTMEDDVFDDDASKRSLLLLDEDARPAVSSDALRRAFATDGAVVGVVVRKSLGAFVVLEVDMNAQSQEGRGV